MRHSSEQTLQWLQSLKSRTIVSLTVYEKATEAPAESLVIQEVEIIDQASA